MAAVGGGRRAGHIVVVRFYPPSPIGPTLNKKTTFTPLGTVLDMFIFNSKENLSDIIVYPVSYYS